MNPQQPSKTSPVVSLLLSLAAVATGCGAGSEAPSGVASQSQSLEGLPATCQDIRTAQPSAPDGPYLLYVGGKAALAWTAWCHDMAGTPKEYLTLEQTGSGSNYSQYLAGGNSTGTTVRTSYTRLRINPVTLRVDTADPTFSTSTGSLLHSPVQVTSMPYAVGMSCNSTQAQAQVDLRGTPFAVAPGQLSLGGSSPQGSAVYSEADQVVGLSGGGSCGWMGPPGSYNPFNQSGAALQLQYRSNALPTTCQDLQASQPGSPDGDYTLYVNRDGLKPWVAYCRNMAGTPSEYLTLAQTGASSNYSQYTAGGNSPGTHVRTVYTRLRLDPVTLRVNTADQTFSTSTGALSHGGAPVTSMPYAAAMGCSTWGVGNVDLRGTPFAVAPGQFRVGGISSSGSFNYSQANQVVALSGYGGCGWVGPVGSFNPFNQSGQPLPLVYAAPQ
ncbi:GON domain-containing protein [Corallococcus llansteffanensis]|uniref:GON domain-containing protein n=1 Tax=Corallococcus llansteffanensis TaxID=2316731 RepID=A0A3A8QES6_9BACT|nr:GON domain-containing protein [Corallococcus llansteffanensis]RKH65430.1 hypothetical protein D7V93_05935 [Corallococcus llansteffanensis]